MKEKDSCKIICAAALNAHNSIALHRTQCTKSQHKQAFVKKSELTATCKMLYFLSKARHCELQTAWIRGDKLIYTGEILIQLLKSHVTDIILKQLISLTLCS